MPMYLPIPEGLEIPETGTFDLVTTFENREGQLYPIAVDGIPFPEMEEQPEAEAETEAEMQPEAEVETTAEVEGAQAPDSFMAAIEKAMTKKQPQ
jgi:hypothetical protein